MILLKSNQLNKIVVTLTQNTTLCDPEYLFQFVHIFSKQEVKFILPDVSPHPTRYNQFEFVEGTGVGQIPFPYEGQYNYYAYAQPFGSGNLNPLLATELVENGIAEFIVVSADTTNENYFEFISGDEFNSNTIFAPDEINPPSQTPTQTTTQTPSPTPSPTPTPTPTCPTSTQFFMTGFLSGTDLQIFLQETLTNVYYSSTCPFDFSLTLVRDDDAISAFTATFTANTDNQTYDISGFLGTNDLKSIIYNSITLDPSCSCVSAKVYNYYRVNRCINGVFAGSVFAESGGTYVNSVRKLIQNGECRTITNTLRDQVGFPNNWEWSYSSTAYTDCNECLSS